MCDIGLVAHDDENYSTLLRLGRAVNLKFVRQISAASHKSSGQYWKICIEGLHPLAPNLTNTHNSWPHIWAYTMSNYQTTEIQQLVSTAYLLVDVYDVLASWVVGMLGRMFDITTS